LSKTEPARGVARRLQLWLRLLLSAAVVAAIAAWIPLGDFLAAMARVGAGLWCAVLACSIAAHLVAAAKWRVLLRACGARVGRIDALAAHGAGLFANNWLPSVVGGDVVRAAVLARRHPGLAAPVVASIADRVIDLGASLGLAAAGVLASGSAESGPALPLLRWATVLLVLGSAAAGLLLWKLDLTRLPERLAGPLGRLREVSAALAAHPAGALAATLLSLAVQTALIALNLALARAMGIEAGLGPWLIAFPLAKIAALAPVSLGGLGVREAAQAALLAPFGVAVAPAMAEGFAWRTVLLGLGLVGGAGSWLATPRRLPGEHAAR